MNNLNNALFHKKEIIRCFNKAASTYDANCDAQKEIGLKLISLLTTYQNNISSIIDLGCGSGCITEKLAEQFIYQKFCAIDISDKLLIQAKKRLEKYHIKISEDDFEYFFEKNNIFDLVFSNMALQWSANLKLVLSSIQKNMNKNGLLAFSIPLHGTYAELAASSRNDFHTQESILNFLLESEWTILHSETNHFSTSYNSWLNALKTIKATGANYVFKKKSSSLSSKSYLYRLVKTKQAVKEKISLSYHIGYFIAGKK